MKITGLQKLTLLDYPEHIAAIIFLGGCNFRCPFCQNSSLVLSPGSQPEISMDRLRDFLKKRQGILEGICVTGGEPTLSPDLPLLLQMIRSEGYLVKLDTNGTNPDMLDALLSDGILDYVAMDIKAGRSNYAPVVGLNAPDGSSTMDLSRICRSVDLLMNSSIDYEFRTTIVKGLHTRTDFEDISNWIAGCRAYYLQSFRDCPEVLLPNHSFSAFSEDELNEFLALVQKKIPCAKRRG